MKYKRKIYEAHLTYVNDVSHYILDPSINGKIYLIVMDSKNNDNNIEKILKGR